MCNKHAAFDNILSGLFKENFCYRRYRYTYKSLSLEFTILFKIVYRLHHFLLFWKNSFAKLLFLKYTLKKTLKKIHIFNTKLLNLVKNCPNQTQFFRLKKNYPNCKQNNKFSYNIYIKDIKNYTI